MKRFRTGLIWLAAIASFGGALFGACARPMAPTGGPVDFIPPMVVSTWPDTFQVIEPTRDPVKILFSERISERPSEGRIEAAVIVSPVTGEHRVKHTRSGLEIEVAGGFKPDLVYRIRVLPTIKDLFNNNMAGPFELVFSTGAPFETNVVAGVVKDRITGEPVGGVRVQATDEAVEDPPVYVATTDTAGVFALRYLPRGGYRLTLFQDVNRNAEADFRELQGSAPDQFLGTGEAAADTVILREIDLLRPDTVPARLIRVEAVDSLLVRLEFDDFMDAESSLDPVGVRITLEDGPEVAIQRRLWPRQLDSIRAVTDSIAAEERRRSMVDSLQVVADSLTRVLADMRTVGDTLGADTVQVALERVQTRLEPPAPPERPAGPEGRRQAPAEPPPILPQQEFFVQLADSLAPDQTYDVVVSGVVNINGLPGGGGESSFTWEPPEPPADTSAAAPDTGAVARPDTGSAIRTDTSALLQSGRRPGMTFSRTPGRLEPLWWLRRRGP